MAREVLLEPLLRWLRLRRVVSHIPTGARLLDIGCGKTAAFLRAVSPRIERGTGIDFKVRAMQFGNIQTMPFCLADELPFADASFDVVTMLAVLEHIESEKLILQEVHRVLQDNGKLILTVPSVWSKPILEFLAYRLKLIDEREIRDHKQYYNQDKLKRILIEEIEFKNFQHQYFQFGMNNFCIVSK